MYPDVVELLTLVNGPRRIVSLPEHQYAVHMRCLAVVLRDIGHALGKCMRIERDPVAENATTNERIRMSDHLTSCASTANPGTDCQKRRSVIVPSSEFYLKMQASRLSPGGLTRVVATPQARFDFYVAKNSFERKNITAIKPD